MMGTSPPALIGKRLGKVLGRKKKRHNLAARVAATGLAACCNVTRLTARLNVIEFKSFADVDLTKWHDVVGYIDDNGRQKKGIVQQVIRHAEMGGRTGADIYDYMKRRGEANESARAGNFKITKNSKNTARITVGPDQRERRKKYMWERVGVQRTIGTALLGSAIVGTAVLAGKLRAAKMPKVVPTEGAATAAQKMAKVFSDKSERIRMAGVLKKQRAKRFPATPAPATP